MKIDVVRKLANITSIFGLYLDSNTDIAARDPEPLITTNFID